MPKIAIIFFSANGTTEALASAVRVGAGEHAEVVAHGITGDDIVNGRFQNEKVLVLVDDADGVAFGSPTYMGGPAAQFKAFADATSDRWTEQRWANKVATGFTIGASANGEQSHTLAYFTILAAQHGMVWCGLDIPGGSDPHGRNRLGSQLGLTTLADEGRLQNSDLATAQYLGQRLAKLASGLAYQRNKRPEGVAD